VLVTPPLVALAPEEGEPFDEQALPKTVSTATIERTERVETMNDSLLAEGRGTADEVGILDSWVLNCNPREIAVEWASGARTL